MDPFIFLETFLLLCSKIYINTPCSNHSGLATIFHTPVTRRVQPASSGNCQVVLLLQQQQAAIKQVLDGQKAFESWQSHIEKELSDLQEKVDTSCSGVDLKTDGKRKRVVILIGKYVKYVHCIIM